MDDVRSLDEIAHAYADGVRQLFAPSGQPASDRDRGASGATNPAELADQAEQLKPTSAALTDALAGRLSSDDPNAALDASTRLLAKALADLQVSDRLLQAAQDE